MVTKIKLSTAALIIMMVIISTICSYFILPTAPHTSNRMQKSSPPGPESSESITILPQVIHVRAEMGAHNYNNHHPELPTTKTHGALSTTTVLTPSRDSNGYYGKRADANLVTSFTLKGMSVDATSSLPVISKHTSTSIDISRPIPVTNTNSRAMGGSSNNYVWTDSDTSSSPYVSYQWLDMSSVGTQITAWSAGNGDNGYFVTQLPFEFTFYGTTYPKGTNIYIGTNGYITFGAGYTVATNTAFPSSTFSHPVIAAFWDDLDCYPYGNGGYVYYYTYETASQLTLFIVEWHAVLHDTTTAETFQVALRNDNMIWFQYNTISSGYSCTVGLQATSTLAVEYSASLTNELAIRWFYSYGLPYTTGFTTTTYWTTEAYAFYDNMESGTGVWQFDPTSGNLWSQTTTEYHSETYSWYSGWKTNDLDRIYTSASAPIDLRGATWAYWIFFFKGASNNGFDGLVFGVKNLTDSSWYAPYWFTGDYSSNWWYAKIDLSDFNGVNYLGNQIQICFQYLVTGSDSTYMNWYVDDVYVIRSSEWHSTSANYYSSSPSRYCGVEALGQYVPNMAPFDSMLSPVIDLTTSQSQVWLDFWHSYDLQTGDECKLWLLDFGTTPSQWHLLATYTGNSGGWVRAKIDLSAYINHHILLAFDLTSDSTNEGIGWFIDDLMLRGNDPPSAPTDGMPIGRTIGNSVTLSWSSAIDPDGDEITYEWYLDDEDTFTEPYVANGTTVTTETLPITTVDGIMYYCKVRARDEYTYADSELIWSFLENTAPTAPTLNTDLSFRVVNHTPLVSWLPSTDAEADSLTYYVYCDSTASPTTIETITVATSAELGHNVTLLDGTAYNWTVCAYDGYEFSEFPTACDMFAMNSPPSIPSVIEPATYQVVAGGGSLYINWTISTNNDYGIDDTITIDIYYSTDNGTTYPETNNIGISEANDGTYLWSPVPLIESSYCKLKLIATDGFESAEAESCLFAIDSISPVINDITVSSNSTWFWVECMNASGGVVWFNSNVGEGAGQALTIFVNWSDANPAGLFGGTAFGDSPSDLDAEPTELIYTVEAGDGDFIAVEINVTDGAGRWTTAHIDFRVDNTPPTTVTEFICHPDSYTDVGQYDDDPEIYLTWLDGIDGDDGCGIYCAELGTSLPPTVEVPAGVQHAIMTTEITEGEAVFYVRMRDHVGNVGNISTATIFIDTTAPDSPIVTSPTHPDQALWYADNAPVFEWEPVSDTSGIIGYSYILDAEPLTTPDDTCDCDNTVTSTSYSDIVDGTWYFHIKVQNSALLWSDATHYRIQIDTTAPTFVQDLTESTGTTGEPVTFKVEVTDPSEYGGSSVAEVILYWRYEFDTTYTEVQMDLESGATTSIYSTSITVQYDDDADIHYYIVAYDAALAVPNSAYLPTTGYKTILITDNDAPTITTVTGDIEVVAGTTVQLEVVATDNIAPTSAKVFLNDDTVGKEMAIESTDPLGTKFTYEFDIEASGDNIENYTYYIVVSDDANNEVRTPATGVYTITVIQPQIEEYYPPIVELSYPNGGETLSGIVEITWTVTDPDGYIINVTLYYSGDAGATWTLLADHVQNNNGGGKYLWDTTEVPNGNRYIVKIIVMDNTSLTATDLSDTVFTIYNPHPPEVSIITPVGGELYSGTIDIEWYAVDPDGDPLEIDIYYSPDGGENWYELTLGEANDGTYAWDTTTVTDGSDYIIKIIARELVPSALYMEAIMDTTFIIANELKIEVTVGFTPTEPVEYGTPVKITAVIHNVGYLTIENLIIRFIADNHTIGSEIIPLLTCGTNITVAYNWTPAQVGKFIVGVTVFETLYTAERCVIVVEPERKPSEGDEERKRKPSAAPASLWWQWLIPLLVVIISAILIGIAWLIRKKRKAVEVSGRAGWEPTVLRKQPPVHHITPRVPGAQPPPSPPLPSATTTVELPVEEHPYRAVVEEKEETKPKPAEPTDTLTKRDMMKDLKEIFGE